MRSRIVVVHLCDIFPKQIKITSTLISKEDQSPLESATVYLETLKDSTLVICIISDKNGVFVLDITIYENSLNQKHRILNPKL
jgi:hypothetical protein